ncbi:MAG: hypothetical protein J6B77_04435 [Clostridia bacterium]|nr:hypothetical protein [Clostridia bacterium]
MRFHKSGSDRESGIRPARLIAIGVIFFAVAFVYFVQMVLLRVWGSESGLYSIYDGGNTKTTLTVEAVRGDIYDRNGVLLVTSETAYQMAFTYDAIPDTSQDFNLSIAKTAKALKENAVERTEVQFPLYGTYPDYGYYAEALDENSEYRTGLLTVLNALGLEQDASCEALVDAMATRYRFKRTDLSDEELDAVFRIRYDMLRCGFGVYTPYVIAEDASEDLMTYIEELDIRGVVFVPKTERVYKFPGYASHILGELGKIPEGALDDYVAQGYAMDATVGVSGCEAAYESVLRGIDGKLVREYDKEGVLIDSHYEKEPVAGNDVYLTIDIEVQIAAEDALKENIENIASAGGELTGGDADAGAVVAIDPKDFSILALASYPTYDLSTYGLTYGDLITDEMKPLLNRALN